MTTLSEIHNIGLAAAKPVDPSSGTLYFSTDTRLLERWSGTAWAAFVAPEMTTEQVQDVVGAMVLGGAGITATYDDVAGTHTIATTITQYTDEQVDDRVAALIVAGANISKTYDDVANTLTLAVTGAFVDPTTTKGDLLVRNATVLTRLPVGANAQVLTADSVAAEGVKWAANPAGFADPLTTKGDLISRTATATVRLPVGADGQVLTASAAAAEGVAWAAAGGGSATNQFHPGFLAGRWYGYPEQLATATAYTSAAPTATYVRYSPLYVPQSVTLDRIGMGFVASIAGTVEMGIYANDNGKPGARLLTTGAVTAATATEAIISYAATGGTWYWLAFQPSSATITASVPSANDAPNLAGQATVNGTTVALLQYIETITGLPATATPVAASGMPFLVRVRAA